MISGIYALLNIVNGKYYIGSAVDFKDRWRLHLLALANGKHHNRHLQKAWNRYTADNFIFVILQYSDSWLEQLEQNWIDKLNATNINLGYNICKAGRNRFGVKASEETKLKLSLAHIGYKASDETKAKMSAIHKGNTVNAGRKWSQEAIEARRKANIGKKRSPEARARMSAAQTGRVLSPEAKLNMSIAAKNRWRKIDNFKDCGHTVQDIAP